jgi:hypothetical protein
VPHTLRLTLLQEAYAVCRMAPGAALPDWTSPGAFLSLTHTPDELSIVCREDIVPTNVHCECGWRCLRVAGPLDLALVGVLAALVVPLAEAGVSVFAVSTFDTDYLLVKQTALARACGALRGAGHTVEEALC